LKTDYRSKFRAKEKDIISLCWMLLRNNFRKTKTKLRGNRWPKGLDKNSISKFLFIEPLAFIYHDVLSTERAISPEKDIISFPVRVF